MNGIIIHEGQTISYIYICGVKPVHEITINENIKLLPVKATFEPDDMIDSIMKFGDGNEFKLGMLISTLRFVTAELRITAKDEEQLAVLTWNAQTICVHISAMLNCEIAYYFQANESAGNFNSHTDINMIYPNMYRLPNQLKVLNQAECNYIENNILVALELDNNTSYSNATNALWCHNLHPRPAIQLSIVWGGIESLFLIEKDIKKSLSLAISRFLYGDDRLEEKVKFLYERRSKAVHELKNSENQDLRDSIDLLHRLIKKCIENRVVPNVEELLSDKNKSGFAEALVEIEESVEIKEV